MLTALLWLHGDGFVSAKAIILVKKSVIKCVM